MELDLLLTQILTEKKNLIVPGFGSFIKSGGEQSYTVIFNEFLKFNDKVLQKAVAEKYAISTDEALAKIETYTSGIQEQLKQEGEYNIPGLGHLFLKNGKLNFKFNPDQGKNSETNSIPVVAPIDAVADVAAPIVEETIPTPAVDDSVLPEPIETEEDQLPQEEYEELMEQSAEVEPSAIDTWEEAQAEHVANTIVEENPSVYQEIIEPTQEETKTFDVSGIDVSETEEKIEPVTNDAPATPIISPLLENKEAPIQKEMDADEIEEENEPDPLPATSELKEQQDEEIVETPVPPVVEPPKVEFNSTEEAETIVPAAPAIEKASEMPKEDQTAEQTEAPKRKKKGLFWIGLLCLIAGLSLLVVLRWDTFSAYLGLNSEQSGEAFTEEIVDQLADIKPHETVDHATEDILEGDTVQTEVEEEITPEEIAETPATETPIEVTPASGQLYHVIGGAFSSKTNAQTFVDQLKSKGYNASNLGKRNGLYTVSYGGSKSKDAAKNLLKKVKENEPNAGSCWILFY